MVYIRLIITIITATLLSCTGIFAAAKSLTPENRYLILASWFTNENDFMMRYDNHWFSQRHTQYP